MNKFYAHSEIDRFCQKIHADYQSEYNDIEKMFVSECDFELDRLHLRATSTNRSKVVADMIIRITSWLEEMHTQEPITTAHLVGYRIQYLYFTRLLKRQVQK